MRFNVRTLILLAAAAVPALAQQVRTDYDHQVDFSKYHSFCVDRVHTGDPFTEPRLRDSLNYRLTHNGLTNAAGTPSRMRHDQGAAPVEIPAACDLSVRAIGSVRNRQEYSTFYNGFGPGWGWGGWGGRGFYGGGFGWGGGPSITSVENIPVGTLVVDVYDTRSRKLLFRGIASSDMSNHADVNTRRMNISIDKIFKKFPPKSKG